MNRTLAASLPISNASSNRVATANLSLFTNVWVEATETIKVGANGTYAIVIKKVSDGTTLLSYSNNNISTIRPSNNFIRPKWGIYRSLTVPADLRDESIRLADFSIAETYPTITIATANTTVCNGSQVTFTTTVNNAGANPIYQWRKNGIVVGSNSNTYTNNNFVNKDTISCFLTCTDPNIYPTTATSNKIALLVKDNTTNTKDTSICSHLFPFVWGGTTFNTAGNKLIHLTNIAGCDSALTLNIANASTIPVITGSNSICLGLNTTLSNTLSGGVWSSIAGRANITTNGLVTPTSVGIAKIKYTIANSSCAGSVFKDIVINATPATPTIAYATGTTNVTGSGGVCKNKTFTLVGTPANGVWSKTGVLTLNPTGTHSTSVVVNTGNTIGAASVTYTITDGNVCTSSRTINTSVINCANKNLTKPLATINEPLFIYPNPAHTLINLKMNKLVGNGKLLIMDCLGKIIKEQCLSMGVNTIDVLGFTKGIYMVNVITEQGKQTQKIIVE